MLIFLFDSRFHSTLVRENKQLSDILINAILILFNYY